MKLSSKLILFTLCALVLTICSANAQMGLLGKKAAKEAKLLKERPLLVVLYDDGELGDYNENIKKAIARVWTYSSDIAFITKDEWINIAKDKSESKKYAQLYFTKKLLGGNAPNNSIVIGLMEKAVSTNFFYTPEVGLPDLMLALKNIQTDLEMGEDYKNIVKNNPKQFAEFLKDSIEFKTLYIDKDLATKKLLKNIDNTYQYDYKLVSKEEIDNAIINKEPEVLFIREFVRAQRPLTKTRLETGENRLDINARKNKRTASMNINLNLVYKASDLEQVGIAGMNGIGSMDEEDIKEKKSGKIDLKGIEMFLKLIR